MSNELFNVDEVLKNAFKNKVTLSELFERKLTELNLKKTNVQDILDIPYRTLDGILTGTQKLVDITNLLKIGDFLQLSKEDVFKLYIDSVQKQHPIVKGSPDKIKLIKDNFDLVVLKKAKLIDSVIDFDHIESRINARLGLKSIFEYRQPTNDVAFSSGIFNPKNKLTRMFWLKAAISTFDEINNPNEFNKEKLIDLIPRISWFSTIEERGFEEVVRMLFQIGITVIYQPPLQGLQLRGATLSVNGSPSVVITNYKGFYSTLWFCLLHELYHVLFDWEDIKNNCYHLSDDDDQELTVQEREKHANRFASEMLFPKSKLKEIQYKFHDEFYIKTIATENHVHESIIYASQAFESEDYKAWARVRKKSPSTENVVKNIDFPWKPGKNLEEMVIEHKSALNII